jgi:hypothetical protein
LRTSSRARPSEIPAARAKSGIDISFLFIEFSDYTRAKERHNPKVSLLRR